MNTVLAVANHMLKNMDGETFKKNVYEVCSLYTCETKGDSHAIYVDTETGDLHIDWSEPFNEVTSTVEDVFPGVHVYRSELNSDASSNITKIIVSNYLS